MTLFQISIVLAITIGLHYIAQFANATKACLVKHNEKPHR